jgi:hypothetical protein
MGTNFFGSTSFFKGIGEHSEPRRVEGAFRKKALLVGGPGQLHHGAAVPVEQRGFHCWRSPERVAEDAAQENRLLMSLVRPTKDRPGSAEEGEARGLGYQTKRVPRGVRGHAPPGIRVVGGAVVKELRGNLVGGVVGEALSKGRGSLA